MKNNIIKLMLGILIFGNTTASYVGHPCGAEKIIDKKEAELVELGKVPNYTLLAGISVDITRYLAKPKAQKKDEQKKEYIKGYVSNRVNVRSSPSTESEVYDIFDINTEVEYIKSENEWSEIKYDNSIAYIYSKYISDTITELYYVDMDTPSNNSFKSYMDADCITAKSTPQYKLKSKYVLGNYGVWTVDGRYCIAVGSYYTTTIGTYIDLVMENGSIVPCILADCKADNDTDWTNRQNPNGSIAEFVVNSSSLPSSVRGQHGSGSLSSAGSELDGEIRYIRVYK